MKNMNVQKRTILLAGLFFFLSGCGGQTIGEAKGKFLNWWRGSTVALDGGKALLASGPTPVLSVSADNAPLLGSNVQLTLTFDNNDATDTGYFPIFRFVLPPELTYSSSDDCGGIGSPTVTVDASDPGVDPYTGEEITLTAGQKLVTVRPNTGQITPDQPPVQCVFTMTASGQTVGEGDLISDIRAIFAIGGTPNGTPSDCGGSGDTNCSAAESETVTPTLLSVTKSSNDSRPFGTGPTYPISFAINGNLASGETIHNVSISDTVQDAFLLAPTPPADCSSFGIVIIPSPTTCTYTPDNTSVSGGTFVITYAELSSDFSFTYSGYVRELDDDLQPIISPTAGTTTTSMNPVSVTADEISGSVDTSDSLSHRSVDVTKTVSNTNDIGGSGNTPGDELTWTIRSAVSDFFQIQNITFADTVGDGLDYTVGSLAVSITENGSTIDLAEADLAGYGTVTPNPDGTTSLLLDLGAAMTANVNGIPDGILSGDATHASGTSTGIVATYKTTIRDNYTTDPGSGDLSVDAGDVVTNTLDAMTFDIVAVGGAVGLTRNASASVKIAPITFGKEITHVNGAPVAPGAIHIEAGDTVTFKLSSTIPGGDAEQLSVSDYLPRPLFSTSPCPTEAVGIPPLAGNWSFGTNTTGATLAPGDVTCSASNNRVEFNFPNFETAGGGNKEFEIYFTATVLPEPFTNGLLQVNLAQLEYNNSTGVASATAVGAVNFIGDAPDLTVEKTIVSTTDAGANVSGGDVSDIDAGGVISYQVELTNADGGTAYDVTLEDIVPTGMEPPAGSGPCSGAACTYSILTDAGCTNGGAVVPDTTTETDQTKVKITNMQLAPSATCTVSYDIKVAASAQFGETITNMATATYASTLGGTAFSPRSDTADATLAAPSVTKTGSVDNGIPPDPVTFNVAVTIPEGTGNSFAVVDVESNNFFEPNDPGGVTVSGGISGAGPYCSDDYPNICFEKDPTDDDNWGGGTTTFTIDLGTVTNTYNDDVERIVTFEIAGIVRPVNRGNRNNRGRVTWNNGSSQTVTSSSIPFAVKTPRLVISECVDPVTTANVPLSLNDTAGYIVQVKNTGSNISTAYDITDLEHVLPVGINYGGGTVTAYHCDAGASSVSCSGWTPASCSGTSVDTSAATRAGESVEASPFGGDDRQAVTFPVENGAGDNTLDTNEYTVYLFTSDISCESAADTTGVDAVAGSHSDDDGIVDGCSSPVAPYSGTLNTSSSIDEYSSQDGVVSGELTDGPANSNSASVNLDHDGDGISNADETSGDADGDGVPNYLDTDSDDNGLSDATEGTGDADGDTLPDYKDTDDDNDGLEDGAEITAGGGGLVDTDGDGNDDYLDPDADGDGIEDGSEGPATTDTDGDLKKDFLDLDSDSDGIPDMLEQGLGAHDTNGSGAFSNAEIAASGLDSSGNNAISAAELGGALPDSDGDGTPNFRDLDSDNDGLSDTDEAGFAVFTGADNLISTAERALIDDGTLPDVSGGAFDDNNVVNVDELPDADSDGTLDPFDIDSDADGVPDIVENRRYVCDSNGNGAIEYPAEVTGCITATDTDADGLIQNDEFAVLDTDSDTTPDYQDRDSDNDGIGDLIEAYGSDIDTVVDGLVTPAEYAAAAGAVGDNDGTLEFSELVNTDSADNADIYDADSDNDTILDVQESDDANDDVDPATVVYTYANLYDSDGDNTPDFRETDSDDDGHTDATEAGDASTLTIPVDTDSDGTPDFQDLDSDGDALNDEDETTLSTNRTNADSDNDGCADGCEVFGNTTIPVGCPYDDAGNAAWYPGVGTVGSPLTLPTDADTDDGGTNDCDEATLHNTNPQAGQGADDSWHTEDPDNDGLTNDEEALLGTDDDVGDTDGDGCTDGCEVFGTTAGCPYNQTQNSDWFTAPGTIGSPVSQPLVLDTDSDVCNDCFEGSTTFTDPKVADNDADGLTDCQEYNLGTDPKDTDSDDDGLTDGEEVNTHNTNPLEEDTDGDGCADQAEVVTYQSDPLSDPDTDGDDLTDCQEDGTYGTDRTKKDTDGGGIDDGVEVNQLQTDPLDATDDCPNSRDTDGDGLTDCEELELGTDMNATDAQLQGSGTKGFFGVGCAVAEKREGVGQGWLATILILLGLAFMRRRREGRGS